MGCLTVAVYVSLEENFDEFLSQFTKSSFGDPYICEVQKPQSPEDDEEEVEVEIQIDDSYLVSLDPAEWKEHDHYKVLGLHNLRYRATAGQIKGAYRQLVLKHHPDKRTVPLKPDQTDYFPAITKSYELLGNPKSRQAYDSVDPTIDDSIPKAKNVTPENFLELFRPVFERNARWSVKQPVPDLGDENSSYDHIMDFYKFWVNFETWREYSYLDEEEKEKGVDREERRYLDKLNKVERQRRRKEEVARLRNLVELAMTNDHRLKRRREEERQRKQEEKERKKAELRAQDEERRAKDEQARRIENEKLKSEAEEKERLKKEKVAYKKAHKEQENILEEFFKKHENFSDPDDIDMLTQWLEDLTLLQQEMDLEELQNLNDKLLPMRSKNEKIKLLKAAISKCSSKVEERKIAEIERIRAQKSVSQNGDATPVTACNEWTNDEIQCLVKAIQALPPGTDKRWIAIANFINSHLHGGSPVKNAKQCVSKAKTLQNISNSEAQQIKEQVKNEAVKNLLTDSQSQNMVNSAPSERSNDNEVWTNNEQKLLEAALKNYPPDTDKRWEKISAAVPGRSKKECMKRYKEIVELLKAKKAAQKSSKTK